MYCPKCKKNVLTTTKIQTIEENRSADSVIKVATNQLLNRPERLSEKRNTLIKCSQCNIEIPIHDFVAQKKKQNAAKLSQKEWDIIREHNSQLSEHYDENEPYYTRDNLPEEYAKILTAEREKGNL